MIQGSVNATVTPELTVRPDQGSHTVEYSMFVMLALLLMTPCLVYFWKVGGLREFCCVRRRVSTAGPLGYGQDDLVDNMERAFGVGAFVGCPGGPNYRLISRPQPFFVHGQSTQASAPPCQGTVPTTGQRMPKSVSFAAKLAQTAAAQNAVVCEPTASLATIAPPAMRSHDAGTKLSTNEA